MAKETGPLPQHKRLAMGQNVVKGEATKKTSEKKKKSVKK